jgi:hypothetical protein
MTSKNEGELKYIEALAEAYPEPISHTDLAKSAGVSKPAVTKAKEKLREYCDLRELAYDKFVLRADAHNFWELFRLYLKSGKIVKLITSKFTISILKRINVHAKIAAQWPAYGEIFEKDDTDLIMEIAIRNLSAARELERITRQVQDEEAQIMLHGIELLQQIQPVLEKLEFRIKDERTVIRYLVLRDKVFALATYEFSRFVETMEIMKELSPKLKQAYQVVYVNTFQFYLKRFLGIWTLVIVNDAKANGVDVREELCEVGALYQRRSDKTSQTAA